MKYPHIPIEKDPMGEAIKQYYLHSGKTKHNIRVFSSQFDEDEIPVSELFRNFDEMNKLEQKALSLAKGKILDVGAGSGCHSLVLQNRKKDVTAIDISKLSVEVMKEKGIAKAHTTNIFDSSFNETFDCILMLMNGSGIVGKIENLPQFFNRAKELLNPEGYILLDSSDLCYLYEDEENEGSFLINLADNYYGEVDFQMQYENTLGDKFDWLYIDFNTLAYHAEENGFKAELIEEGEHFDYLAKLSLKKK